MCGRREGARTKEPAPPCVVRGERGGAGQGRASEGPLPEGEGSEHRRRIELYLFSKHWTHAGVRHRGLSSILGGRGEEAV